MDVVVAEFYNPGQRVRLLLEMPRELGEAEVKAVEQELNGKGIRVSYAQYGSTPEWPRALSLVIMRPDKVGTSCQGAMPVTAFITSALSAIGIGELARWRVDS